MPTIALGLTDEQMRPESPLSAFSELSSDADEVARIEGYHNDTLTDDFDAPLFGRRGLFADTTH